MNEFILLMAFIVDILIGDPQNLPHPVVIIGSLINYLENHLNKINYSNIRKIINGGLLVFVVLSLTYISTWIIVQLSAKVSPVIGFIASIWLISTTVSLKGLKEAGLKIKVLLDKNNLKEARKETGFIVGRDTNNMNEAEITRATVETIAENIVDGVTSPFFYAFIGGAPLALTYRAVNTLDSMLGYKNDKYLYFGKIAARVDDFFNFIPARFTGICIIIIAYLLPNFSGKNSLKILLRDSKKHPSPNSGFSESAVAGALKVRLGGLNYYHGIASFRPHIGDNINPLNKEMILQTNTILFYTSFLWIILITLIEFLIF